MGSQTSTSLQSTVWFLHPPWKMLSLGLLILSPVLAAGNSWFSWGSWDTGRDRDGGYGMGSRDHGGSWDVFDGHGEEFGRRDDYSRRRDDYRRWDDHHDQLNRRPSHHDQDDHDQLNRRPSHHDRDDHDQLNRHPSHHDRDDHDQLNRRPSHHDRDDHDQLNRR